MLRWLFLIVLVLNFKLSAQTQSREQQEKLYYGNSRFQDLLLTPQLNWIDKFRSEYNEADYIKLFDWYYKHSTFDSTLTENIRLELGDYFFLQEDSVINQGVAQLLERNHFVQEGLASCRIHESDHYYCLNSPPCFNIWNLDLNLDQITLRSILNCSTSEISLYEKLVETFLSFNGPSKSLDIEKITKLIEQKRSSTGKIKVSFLLLNKLVELNREADFRYTSAFIWSMLVEQNLDVKLEIFYHVLTARILSKQQGNYSSLLLADSYFTYALGKLNTGELQNVEYVDSIDRRIRLLRISLNQWVWSIPHCERLLNELTIIQLLPLGEGNTAFRSDLLCLRLQILERLIQYNELEFKDYEKDAIVLDMITSLYQLLQVRASETSASMGMTNYWKFHFWYHLNCYYLTVRNAKRAQMANTSTHNLFHLENTFLTERHYNQSWVLSLVSWSIEAENKYGASISWGRNDKYFDEQVLSPFSYQFFKVNRYTGLEKLHRSTFNTWDSGKVRITDNYWFDNLSKLLRRAYTLQSRTYQERGNPERALFFLLKRDSIEILGKDIMIEMISHNEANGMTEPYLLFTTRINAKLTTQKRELVVSLSAVVILFLLMVLLLKRTRIAKQKAIESERIQKFQKMVMYQLGHTAPGCIDEILKQNFIRPETKLLLERLHRLLYGFHISHRKQYTLLGNEVNLINPYMDFRYANNARKIEKPSSLIAHNLNGFFEIQAPLFVLLNLVNNAFEHGKQLHLNGSGNIEIVMIKKPNWYYVTISNPSNKPEPKDDSTGLDFISDALSAWNEEDGTFLSTNFNDGVFTAQYRFKERLLSRKNDI